MSISEKKKASNKAWRNGAYERISFNFPRGAREDIKTRADRAGDSVNAFVLGLLGYTISDDLSREKEEKNKK